MLLSYAFPNKPFCVCIFIFAIQCAMNGEISFSLFNLNVPSTTKLYFCKFSLQPLMSSMKYALTLSILNLK